jgi:predicted  nucleic acid-binding Zn-ribbon protein
MLANVFSTQMPDNTSSTKSTSALVSATLREHTAPLTERTEAIVSASQSISAQRRILVQDTQKLSRQAQELEKTLDQSVDQLKEMGDLQNWAEVVFRDISVIEETLRMVEEEEEAANSRGDDNPDIRAT